MAAVDKNTNALVTLIVIQEKIDLIHLFCEDKKCYSHWNNNDNTEWGLNSACPYQPDGETRLKYPDEKPCDTCDISECCYLSLIFIKVPIHILDQSGNIIYSNETGNNTNVKNVNFPDNTYNFSS